MEWYPPKLKIPGSWFTNNFEKTKTENIQKRLQKSNIIHENMDEQAHYTTWQSCSLKIARSLKAYTLVDDIFKPTR